MLDMSAIDLIVKKTAKSMLGTASVSHVTSKPWVDWVGKDALHVLVVFDDGAVDQITGEMIGNFLLTLNETLEDNGEDRRPFVQYATVGELAELDHTHA